MRCNDRTAEFAHTIRTAHIELDDRALALLIEVINCHTHAAGHRDIRVQT